MMSRRVLLLVWVRVRAVSSSVYPLRTTSGLGRVEPEGTCAVVSSGPRGDRWCLTRLSQRLPVCDLTLPCLSVLPCETNRVATQAEGDRLRRALRTMPGRQRGLVSPSLLSLRKPEDREGRRAVVV